MLLVLPVRQLSEVRVPLTVSVTAAIYKFSDFALLGTHISYMIAH